MQKSTLYLHIIEPTCNDHTGHCYGYIEAITSAADKSLTCHLWLGTNAQKLKFSNKQNILHYFFNYKLRKLQSYFLYKKLLRQQQTIFVSTASALDIFILNKLIRRITYKNKIILHFHQLNKKTKKLKRLKQVAPNINEQLLILTPTKQLTDTFRQLGFDHVSTIPCPVPTKPSTTTNAANEAPHLLYAGAARKDKGFPLIVGFIDWLTSQQWQPDFVLQASTTHSGKIDDASQAALQKLPNIDYPNLKQIKTSVSPKQYAQQFDNAITLLIYDIKSYADKFSGICLDALLRGSPIITCRGTWLGDTIERFDAGIVLEQPSPAIIYEAAKKITDNYQEYQQNALQASQILAKEHHPKHTIERIQKFCSDHC